MVLAKQLGPSNITVNAIHLSAFKRIADMAGFLASSDSRWITGQHLDGGGGVL